MKELMVKLDKTGEEIDKAEKEIQKVTKHIDQVTFLTLTINTNSLGIFSFQLMDETDLKHDNKQSVKV